MSAATSRVIVLVCAVSAGCIIPHSSAYPLYSPGSRSESASDRVRERQAPDPGTRRDPEQKTPCTGRWYIDLTGVMWSTEELLNSVSPHLGYRSGHYAFLVGGSANMNMADGPGRIYLSTKDLEFRRYDRRDMTAPSMYVGLGVTIVTMFTPDQSPSGVSCHEVNEPFPHVAVGLHNPFTAGPMNGFAEFWMRYACGQTFDASAVYGDPSIVIGGQQSALGMGIGVVF